MVSKLKRSKYSWISHDSRILNLLHRDLVLIFSGAFLSIFAKNFDDEKKILFVSFFIPFFVLVHGTSIKLDDKWVMKQGYWSEKSIVRMDSLRYEGTG